MFAVRAREGSSLSLPDRPPVPDRTTEIAADLQRVLRGELSSLRPLVTKMRNKVDGPRRGNAVRSTRARLCSVELMHIQRDTFGEACARLRESVVSILFHAERSLDREYGDRLTKRLNLQLPIIADAASRPLGNSRQLTSRVNSVYRRPPAIFERRKLKFAVR